MLDETIDCIDRVVNQLYKNGEFDFEANLLDDSLTAVKQLVTGLEAALKDNNVPDATKDCIRHIIQGVKEPDYNKHLDELFAGVHMRYTVEIEDLDKLKRALSRVQSAWLDVNPVEQGELPSLESEEVSDCISEIEYVLLGLEPVSLTKEELRFIDNCKDKILVNNRELIGTQFSWINYYCKRIANYIEKKDFAKVLKDALEARYMIGSLKPVTNGEILALERLSAVFQQLAQVINKYSIT